MAVSTAHGSAALYGLSGNDSGCLYYLDNDIAFSSGDGFHVLGLSRSLFDIIEIVIQGVTSDSPFTSASMYALSGGDPAALYYLDNDLLFGVSDGYHVLGLYRGIESVPSTITSSVPDTTAVEFSEIGRRTPNTMRDRRS